MSERRLDVLLVNTSDSLGGAARVASDLAQAYRSRGHRAWLAVSEKMQDDPETLVIPEASGVGRVVPGLRRLIDLQLGIEDFNYPSTRRLLDLPPVPPDVIHCHNLHGSYFDLRAMVSLSHRLPVIVTLHDAWLMSGHCAHSMECERWKTGCGACPDLTLYPSVRRDATAYNWRRKRDIYEKSTIALATPCRWLMRKVEQSVLAVAVREARIIPNGIDLTVFQPADRRAARRELAIPPNSRVVLFAAQAARQNVWKDYATLRHAIGLAADRLPAEDLHVIALGDDGASENVGRARWHAVPYQRERRRVARYFQAAEIYVHAARAETFPLSVLEALACGTPVIATAIGGIPEQIEDGETGFLVEPADPAAMAQRLTLLLTDAALRERVGARAAAAARARFDIHDQAESYLNWYNELARKGPPSAAGRPDQSSALSDAG